MKKNTGIPIVSNEINGSKKSYSARQGGLNCFPQLIDLTFVCETFVIDVNAPSSFFLPLIVHSPLHPKAPRGPRTIFGIRTRGPVLSLFCFHLFFGVRALSFIILEFLPCPLDWIMTSASLLFSAPLSGCYNLEEKKSLL